MTAILDAGDAGDDESAWLTGERLRVTIAATSFPGREAQQTTHVTASVGVSTYPDQADEAQTLVANADAALYAAKRKGKNRVEIYE